MEKRIFVAPWGRLPILLQSLLLLLCLFGAGLRAHGADGPLANWQWRNPLPAENPLTLIPLAKQPVTPFNITRNVMAPIHPKTELMNLVYQRLLHGTPWEFYQIATTQWPRLEGNQAAPVPATQGGEITTTFPGAGATSASRRPPPR